MTVRGTVISKRTNEPLQNATIQVVNSEGVYLGQGVRTDNSGQFALTSDILTGNYLLISYTGMESIMIETGLLKNSFYVSIPLQEVSLPEVVVTPKKKGFPWFLLLLLGLGGIAVAKKKK